MNKDKVLKYLLKEDHAKFLSDLNFAVRHVPYIDWESFLLELSRSIRDFPDEIKYLRAILTKGQIMGKKWLVDEVAALDIDLNITYLLCGWSGFVGKMMLESENVRIKKCRSFDINPNAVDYSERFNKKHKSNGWAFKASCYDITTLNYHFTEFQTLGIDGVIKKTIIESPDTIILTACEHIPNFEGWWKTMPKGLLVAVQSADNENEEHVSCASSLSHFQEQLNLSETYYAGSREFFYYKRFMVIGRV